MELEIKLMKRLVDEKVSLTELLDKVDPGMRHQIGQPCYCPFHDNQKTPSAAIYEDEETGKETLWCFSEKLQYTASDALNILLGKDIYRVADAIWTRMTPGQRNSWLSRNGGVDYSKEFSTTDQEDEPKENKELERAKDAFKSKKSNVKDLLKVYVNTK